MPMAMRLCAGATSIPVKVVPNADLPTDTGKVPFIIGDLTLQLNVEKIKLVDVVLILFFSKIKLFLSLR